MRIDLVTVFLGVPALSKARIHCQRSAPFHQGKPAHSYTSHLYSFTSINSAPFAVVSWCFSQVVFSSDLQALIGQSDFTQSVACKFFETFRAF